MKSIQQPHLLQHPRLNLQDIEVTYALKTVQVVAAVVAAAIEVVLFVRRSE